MSIIPIRNIYVMLAYASRDAGRLGDEGIAACDFERPFDLIARLLDASMHRLRHRGVERNYLTQEEQGSCPRGTISIPTTISKLLHVRGELAWSVDELVAATPSNRVLKASLRHLITQGSVAGAVRRRLRAHVAALGTVQDLTARDAVHLHVIPPRGNPEYLTALRLARLALEHLLPDEGQSGVSWKALLHDPERMGELFEGFIRGFAAHEYAGEAVVSAKPLTWGTAEDYELLPMMRTDVYVDWHHSAPTICECKYYQNPLIRHQWGQSDKLHAAHLYQLMAYLRAVQRTESSEPCGVLLYAMAGKAISERWELEGFQVDIVSVDLSQEWAQLRDDMIGIFTRSRRGDVHWGMPGA